MSSVEICGLLFVLKYNTSDSSILLSLIINFILDFFAILNDIIYKKK